VLEAAQNLLLGGKEVEGKEEGKGLTCDHTFGLTCDHLGLTCDHMNGLTYDSKLGLTCDYIGLAGFRA
jgi:hypothetical protein